MLGGACPHLAPPLVATLLRSNLPGFIDKEAQISTKMISTHVSSPIIHFPRLRPNSSSFLDILTKARYATSITTYSNFKTDSIQFIT